MAKKKLLTYWVYRYAGNQILFFRDKVEDPRNDPNFIELTDLEGFKVLFGTPPRKGQFKEFRTVEVHRDSKGRFKK